MQEFTVLVVRSIYGQSAKLVVYTSKRKHLMNFTTKEKKKLNEFLDKYQYLLEEGDYVNFLKEYRKQNGNTRNALYYRFVDLIKDTFELNIEWFIKNDSDFYWINYFGKDSDITHINIPTAVTTIPNYAFF